MKPSSGLLATLNGIAGCLHYSLGRGTGGLIGGTIVAVTGSLAVAFRCQFHQRSLSTFRFSRFTLILMAQSIEQNAVKLEKNLSLVY